MKGGSINGSGGGSTYRSGPDTYSLVDFVLASGTAKREVNASPDYTVGAAYYTTRPARITGIRFFWLRAAGVATESVKLSLFDTSGARLATVTVTVGCDGPQEAYFSTPVDVPAYRRIVAAAYFATAHMVLALSTAAPIRPSLGYGGATSGVLAQIAGPGLVLVEPARATGSTVGDAYPSSVIDYAAGGANTIYAVEPIVQGARATPGTAKHIWVEGDSISVAAGVNAGSGTTQYPTIPVSWASMLGLPPGSTVTNRAVASRTLVANVNNSPSSNNIAANLSTCLAAYDANTARDIVVFAGTNDAYFASDASTCLAALGTVLNTIRTGCPLDRIWVMTAIARNNWSGSPVYLGSAAAHNAILTAFNAGAPAVAATYGATIIDTAAAIPLQTPSNTVDFQGDQCHPTYQGQLVIAHVARRAFGLI